MRDPKVSVALAGAGERDSLVLVSSGGGKVLQTLQWELGALEREGYMGVCEKLGNAVMRLLAKDRPEIFAKYPFINPPRPLVSDPVHMVMELMDMCVKFKSRAYIPAIDEMFKRYDKELSMTSLPASWSGLREGFLRFP